MPSVPVYGPRKVAPKPLPNARLQTEETFASSGGVIGEAQARFGLEVARVSGPVMQILEQERERADQVANLTTLRQLNELDQLVLRHPEQGYLNTRGKAAIEEREAAIARWEEGAGAIGATLRNPRQQFFFEQQRVNRHAQLMDQANRHLVDERTRYDAAETSALLETGTNRIAVNAGMPHIVAGTMAEQTATIDKYAQRNSLGEYETTQLREKTLNAGWTAAITQNLAAKNPKLANDYFTWATANGELTGSAKTQMQTAVTTGLVEQKGDALATDVWRRLGPTDPSQPVKIFDLHEEVRMLAGDDSDAMKAAIDGLNRRKQAWDAQNAAQEDASIGTLTTMVLARVPPGATSAVTQRVYQQIKATPAYINAPPKVQADIKRLLEDEGIRNETRLYTEEARLSAREAREVSALQRQQLRLEINGWAQVWRLEQDPVTLAKTPPADILRLAPTLGIAHTNRLLEAQKDLQRPAALSTASIDSDQFKAIAYKGGVTYIYKTPGEMTPEEAANSGRLLATVQNEIARREAGGKKLTYEEKGGVVQQVLDQKVTIDPGGMTGWWYGKEDKSIALVTNPEDQAAALVQFNKIPAVHQTELTNLLRAARPWLKGDDKAVQAQYQRAIERAYGAYLLGLGDEEIQRRLQETP